MVEGDDSNLTIEDLLFDLFLKIYKGIIVWYHVQLKLNKLVGLWSLEMPKKKYIYANY